MTTTVGVAPHPLLEIGAFLTRFSAPIVELTTPDEIVALLDATARAPLSSSDTVRAEVRQLLRHGGFKPAGRSKPASEYLHAAAQEARFPRINAAVDACNAVSLHSGLPISLVDADRLSAPPFGGAARSGGAGPCDRTNGALTIAILPPGTTYVFNPSGQVIDAGGLIALCDGDGASGTPVKDAQRTKTHDGTRAAISIVWGTRALPGRTEKTTAWYRELVERIPGAVTEQVHLVRSNQGG